MNLQPESQDSTGSWGMRSIGDRGISIKSTAARLDEDSRWQGCTTQSIRHSLNFSVRPRHTVDPWSQQATSRYGPASWETYRLTASTWEHRTPKDWPTRSLAFRPKLSALLLSAHSITPVFDVQNLTWFLQLLAGRDRRMTPINNIPEPPVLSWVTQRDIGKFVRSCKRNNKIARCLRSQWID